MAIIPISFVLFFLCFFFVVVFVFFSRDNHETHFAVLKFCDIAYIKTVIQECEAFAKTWSDISRYFHHLDVNLIFYLYPDPIFT